MVTRKREWAVTKLYAGLREVLRERVRVSVLNREGADERA